MEFGNRVRELRHAKGWSLRETAGHVGVGYAYLSRVENKRLLSGDYPSDALIHRLAESLDGDEEELLFLAGRIPERIRKRILKRPEVFGLLADLDDKALNRVMAAVDSGAKKMILKPRKPR